MTVIRIRCTLNLSPTYLFSKKLRFLIREVRVPLPKYVKAVIRFSLQFSQTQTDPEQAVAL